MEPTQAPQQPQEPTPQAEPAQPAQPPYPPVQPSYPAPQPVGTPGKGLAITALVLGIVAAVLSLFWFIAAPLAITAIIFAIVSLVKHRPGKGMSIAGLIVGGVALVVFIPFWLLLTFAAYNAIGERANELQTPEQGQVQVQ